MRKNVHMRTKKFATIFLLGVAALVTLPGQAASPAAARNKVASEREESCQRDVAAYLETMRLLRKSAGDMSMRWEVEGNVSEAEINRVTAAKGICAASQRIVDARLARCQKDVDDYVKTMRFLQEAAGKKTTAWVGGAFVSEEELAQVTRDNGPCFASQTLRDKGVIR